MIQIGMSLNVNSPDTGWDLMRQCGVEHAVGGVGLRPIEGAADDDQPYSEKSLARARDTYAKHGFTLSLMESRPPMEKTKLGLPGRDEELDVVCTLIRSMGAVGIPVWCYAWMPILMVIRTSRTICCTRSTTFLNSVLSPARVF